MTEKIVCSYCLGENGDHKDGCRNPYRGSGNMMNLPGYNPTNAQMIEAIRIALDFSVDVLRPRGLHMPAERAISLLQTLQAKVRDLERPPAPALVEDRYYAAGQEIHAKRWRKIYRDGTVAENGATIICTCAPFINAEVVARKLSLGDRLIGNDVTEQGEVK